MIVWVIGAGGLLGSAVQRCAEKRDDTVLVSSLVPWSSPDATVSKICSDAKLIRDLLKNQAYSGRKWAIVWAAGRATTASSADATDQELATFRGCLQVIGENLGSSPNGTFALASSAGGVYAGSVNPPFSSSSQIHPLGPYGWLKVQQEEASREILDSGLDVVIFRIANLYGPGQDLNKPQGLISRLALTSVTKEPLTMFVPLDFKRDYISANDAAARLLHWIDVASSGSVIRTIASGEATSLGYLVNLMKDITRVRTPIAYGLHESADFQSSDLRLVPDRDASIDYLPRTSLPAGMKSVYEDVLWRKAQGRE